MNALKQLEHCRQSPWLDDLHRTLITSGELDSLIKVDGLKGLTSNPAIFEKAIGDTDDYKETLKDLLSKGQLDDMGIYESIAIEDIQAAADKFRPVYDAAERHDGFVSLEVSPYIADKTDETIAEARRLWKAVGRDNLMIKIPGTEPGTPAIEMAISEGINVNVTLLFSVKAYEDVAHAYIRGLKAFDAKGGDVSKVASVASFFLSRIDALVDKKLDELKGADKAAIEALRGKVAVANAKRAYQRYKAIYASAEWSELAAKGAKPQRLLWASTGTKSASLPDTYYIDTLIGPDTVNTMPPETMKAFRDHGKAQPGTIESDIEGAEKTLKTLADLGVSLDDVTHELVIDGVKKFSQAFDKLMGGVAKRRQELGGSRPQAA